MGECGNKIGWGCDGKHLELTKLAYCSPFRSIVTFICFLLSHTSAFSSIRKLPAWSYNQMQKAVHPHKARSWTMKKKKTWEREGTLKGGAEKFRAWGIEQTATFHHQNSNKQLFRKKKALNRVDLFRRVKSRRWDQTGLWYFCHVWREPYSWEDTLVNKRFLYPLFILCSLPMYTYTSMESVPKYTMQASFPHCIWI